MVDVFNASTARSFNSEVVFKEHVVSGTYATAFALGLHHQGRRHRRRTSRRRAASTRRSLGSRASAGRESVAKLGFAADHSEAHKAWWPADLVDRADDESG